MNDQQPLIDKITQLAIDLSLAQISNVDVRYSGIANQLRVTVGATRSRAPRYDEHVELSDPADSEISKVRVCRRLREVIAKLERVQQDGPPQLGGAA